MGYKVFNPDWTCREYQYEVGKTFEHDGNIEMCGAGFHFCRKASDCFEYYGFNSSNKVAEVEALGLLETSGNKSVTNKIKIVREIPWHKLLDIVNEGHDNNGLCNTGDCNTGNRNTGNRNTGDCNTGNWNTGNWNTGFFNTVTPPVRIFNKLTKISRKRILESIGLQAMNWKYEDCWWVYSENMTDEEKAAHPTHETTGGYLKTVGHREACALMWKNMDDRERAAVLELPNFDAGIFKEVTGIEVVGP